MKPSELFAVLEKAGELVELSGKVEKNAVFAAARGTMADGHDFIPEALKKGASLVLCEKRDAY